MSFTKEDAKDALANEANLEALYEDFDTRAEVLEALGNLNVTDGGVMTSAQAREWAASEDNLESLDMDEFSQALGALARS